jgi:hypothetical protein
MKLHKITPLLLVPAITMLAQDDTNDSTEDVFELSPFVVDAAQDTGYYASQTLAGTRLKTDVRDVGTSIQILTSEFLDDVGAENINDLFLYTTNTEAAGINGNFTNYTRGALSFDDESFRVNPQGAQRIRGLTSADRTRNYFLTRLPGDRYITERVEINRGANSILFGLGSPAGIANDSLKQARYSDFGEIRHRFDSEGAQRFEFDYNKELIEDRLAIRVAALVDRQDYYQEPAFQDQDRFYINVNARPWEGAAIRAFYETGNRDANRPSLIAPASNIEYWFDANAEVRQKVQDVLDEYDVLDINGNPLTVPGNMVIAWDAALADWHGNRLDNQGQVDRLLGRTDVDGDGDQDADDDLARIHAFRNMVVYPQSNAERYVRHPSASRNILRVFNWDQPQAGGSAEGTNAIQANVNTAQWNADIQALPSSFDLSGNGRYSTLYNVSLGPWEFRDTSLNFEGIDNLDVFDFTKNLISGDAAFQNDDWDHYNIAFEQLFLEDQVGFEIAYDKQEYERESFVPFQGFTQFYVDTMVNVFGEPNPNFGRPFVSGRTNKNDIYDERDTLRLTGFVRFNPAAIWDNSRLARWLGEHTFTGLYNTYNQEDRRIAFRDYYIDDTITSTVRSNDDAQGDSNRQAHRYMVYLSDQDLSQLNSYADVRLNPLTNQQLWNPGHQETILDLDPVTGIPYERTITSQVFIDNYSTSEQEVDSVAAIWNGYFLNRNLVGLVGWRKDDAYTAAFDAFFDPETDLPDPDVLELTSGGNTITTETLSWSIVAHVPDNFMPEGTGLSFHYGVSENFSIGESSRDLYGNTITAPSGETKEYGVTAQLFDGKLYARLNWFETDLKNRPLQGSANYYNIFINRILLHTYANLKESQVRGPQASSVDPESGVEHPGTPNFDLGMAALSELEQIIPEAIIREANVDGADGFGAAALNRDDLSFGDTEDVVAEGFEVEVTYNPTRNWRISLNVAQQETVTSNYSPRLQELRELTDPYLDSVTGSLKDLTFFPNYDEDPIDYMTGPFTDNNTIGERSEVLVYNGYRLALAQQGRASDEQRKWRVNLITNYNFRDGFLDGFGVGAAYRWQDGAVIGYPAEVIDGQVISDVNNPHIGPSESTVDVWFRYRRKLFNEKVDWTIELRVQNINTDAEELIPVIAQTTKEYDVAVWRSGPPRIWRITNTFKF